MADKKRCSNCDYNLGFCCEFYELDSSSCLGLFLGRRWDQLVFKHLLVVEHWLLDKLSGEFVCGNHRLLGFWAGFMTVVEKNFK